MREGMKRSMRPSRVACIGALAAPVLVLAASAGAAEKVRLTIISGNNHNFAPVGAAIKDFVPKVDEILARTGKYEVSWVQGFGGQIVKVRGELDGVQTGLGDLGVVPGPFHPGEMSLYQIAYVTPFTTLDVQVATDAMNRLYAKFPAMEKQMQRFNQSLLGITGIADYYNLWTKKKITKFTDLKGMKVGAVGSNIPWVAAAGATPVTIKGLATMYNALKTGIYEGCVLWQQAMAGFKFCEIATHKLDVGFGAVANAVLTANMDSWPKIPREVQAAIKEAAATWSLAANRRIIGGGKWGLGVCEKKYGQETHARRYRSCRRRRRRPGPSRSPISRRHGPSVRTRRGSPAPRCWATIWTICGTRSSS